MRLFKLIYKGSVFLFISFVIVLIGFYSHAYFSDPISLSKVGTYALYDENEELIYQGSSQSKWVEIKDMSENYINAVISVEDKNFYNHSGFDYLRIIKALIKNAKNKTIVEGASTISQQYIKNAYLDFDQTWSRKIKEALMTLNLEMHYTKDEILEAYVNTINFGQGCYGIHDAALYYFNKSPKDLTLEEATILAGIPKNPSNYNPVKSYDNAIKRAKIVALTMLNNKKISEEEFNNLFTEQVEIYAEINENELQMIMYFQDAVRKELEEIPGITKAQISSGSLHVYTTLNYEAQKTMEKEMLEHIHDDKLQTAGVIINPHNGAVLALSGGINYNESQYNRALYSKRQVGSTMKPFLYYAALNNGMTSSSTFLSQYTTFNLSEGKTYAPKNFGNIYGNKEITMAAAIAYSDNIYAVKTNLFLGVEELINTTHRCGIEADLNEVPSLALGTSEINLLDFAKGYTTFASGGYLKKIHFITRVEDEEGHILYEFEPESDLVLNPNYVYILNELLTSPTNSAFIDYNSPTALNIASRLTGKYAFKTGTTDTDYWVVGYNSEMLMVTWSGYDDNSDLPIASISEARHIWADTMETLKDKESQDVWYEIPDNVIGLPLDAVSGRPTNDSSHVNMFYYIKGSEPGYSIEQYKKEEIEN